MEDINNIEKEDSLNEYKFTGKDAEDSFYYSFNRITYAQDELRDFIHDMEHDDYCRTTFQGNELKTCIEKADAIISELETLYEDVIDAYKKKGLLIK